LIPDWHELTQIMAPKGRIVLLTILDEEIKVPTMPFVTQGLSIYGSVVAPRHCCKEMLEFVTRNHVKPIVRTFPLNVDGITEAMHILRQGKIRYRAVLVPQE
jgi:D-arabinose 1-dehydrogenase-like Zn-dependent alcohol dehydrogenase